MGLFDLEDIVDYAADKAKEKAQDKATDQAEKLAKKSVKGKKKKGCIGGLFSIFRIFGN
ncbi:MAG: hypothetical protein IKX36_07595 [Prevotella sp.]|nr:hypothetical protein [Prevotella sp.]